MSTLWIGLSRTLVSALRGATTDPGDSWSPTVQDALRRLQSERFDCVCITWEEGAEQDFEVLSHIRRADPRVPVVFYRPGMPMEHSIALREAGAYFCAVEPLSPERVVELLQAARRSRAASDAAGADWKQILIGESRSMRRVRDTIELIGDRRCTVLITGESGTGKELAARSLHLASDRRRREMVSVNCAALPETLLEAELFGHTRGAFTGAQNARVGRFELAHQSTIFLDEIGEMPLETQAKLLRVLQERELHRVGSSETIRIDVRVIAASNRDLLQGVRDRTFREDLLYRLRVVELRMPPLRERIEDVPTLVDHFVTKVCVRERMAPKSIDRSALDRLQSHKWPGNVRELENTVEAAVVLSGERRWLSAQDFQLMESEPAQPAQPGAPPIELPSTGVDLPGVVAQVELALLEQALRQACGNKAKAADMLRIPRTTLISKFKAHRIAV